MIAYCRQRPADVLGLFLQYVLFRLARTLYLGFYLASVRVVKAATGVGLVLNAAVVLRLLAVVVRPAIRFTLSPYVAVDLDER